MSKLVPLLRRYRTFVLIGCDVAAWFASFALFAWLRYDQASADVPWQHVHLAAAATAGLYVVCAWFTQLHRGRASTASLEEMVLLGVVVMSVGAVATSVNMLPIAITRDRKSKRLNSSH